MYTEESKPGGSWKSSPKTKRGLSVFPSHEEEWNHSKNNLLEAIEENSVAKITAVGKGFHAKLQSRRLSMGTIGTSLELLLMNDGPV
jgi:hypothetical protein